MLCNPTLAQLGAKERSGRNDRRSHQVLLRFLDHSCWRQTAERVLIHADTDKSEQLVNNRFGYVSVSRGQYDAQIY